ncbi:hypothetical protein BJX66DRAFT_299924 [Aspergillus keveii]|uniref:Secreted protein n=1 Tax=Aspergillus keveii TaxID=714993 RepID=A0ABR4GBC6_9EURO
MCCSRPFLITSLLPILEYTLLCQLFTSSSELPSLPLVSFSLPMTSPRFSSCNIFFSSASSSPSHSFLDPSI